MRLLQAIDNGANVVGHAPQNLIKVGDSLRRGDIHGTDDLLQASTGGANGQIKLDDGMRNAAGNAETGNQPGRAHADSQQPQPNGHAIGHLAIAIAAPVNELLFQGEQFTRGRRTDRGPPGRSGS